MPVQPEVARCSNSVSDILYSTDEIEYLLEDIKALEPKNCNPDEIQESDAGMSVVLQDFEIAGSQTGALSVTGCECNGGNGIEHDTSPLGTVNSWDSHSHYRRHLDSSDFSLYSGIVVFCDHTHLKTPTGIVRVLLLVTTITCLTCLCTSGTSKVGLFMLPLNIRLRFMMFVTLLTIFVVCLLLFLNISHIDYLFPINWSRMNAYLFIFASSLFIMASSLIIYTLFVSDEFSWVPNATRIRLIITASLGYLCSFQSALLALIEKLPSINSHYQPVTEDPSFIMQERGCNFHLEEIEESPIDEQEHLAVPTTSYKLPMGPIATNQQSKGPSKS